MNSAKADKMMKKFKKRIDKEKVSNEKNEEFDFVEDGKYWYFRFRIVDGPYKGQNHIVKMLLHYGRGGSTYVYPMSPPLCTFVTPIWHPNISEKGTICLDVLKGNWSPSMFTATVVSALKVLLLTPNPSSPQNPKAGRMMVKEPDVYTEFIYEFYDYEKVPRDIRKLFD